MSNARFGLRVRNGLVRPITEGLSSLDADALAFINAANITDLIQIGAINELVLYLKTFGLWTKMKAIYPFVGGTASAHRFNLKDPRDLDAAFRLTFFGGWTHSATGALPNGTNAYANTFFNFASNLIISSAHVSKYNRNNDLTGIKPDGIADTLVNRFAQQNYSNGIMALGDSAFITYTPSSSTGFFATTRTANNILKSFRNLIQLGSTNTTTVNNYPNFNFFIGARNDNGSPSFYNSYEAAFASIGDGLTDTEAANLYTAVQSFQTRLSRQV